MNKIILLPLFCILTAELRAQSISDCSGAIGLCGDVYSEEQAPLNTGNLVEYTGVCNNSTEWNSVWYTFTVQSDGTLGFVLTPNNLNDDYDWALFDITNGGCAGITAAGASPEVSCNSWGTLTPPNGPTGISSAQGGVSNSGGPGDQFGPPFNADLPVLTGQAYALVVMNWTSSLDGYTIDFGESTADLYDNNPPVLEAAQSDCANTQITLTFSEPISMASVVNFDFNITGPGGSYNIIAANPQQAGATLDDIIIIDIDGQIIAPGVYTINITDGNGFVEDACGNLATIGISIELFAPLTYTTEITSACNGSDGAIEVTTITGGNEPYSILLNGMAQSGTAFTGLNSGNYQLSINDNSGCQIQNNVVIPNHLISVFAPLQDTLSCINPAISIQGVVVTPEQSVNYDWDPITPTGNIVSGSNTAAPVINQPGIYVLVVTDTQVGCVASFEVEVPSGEVYGVDVSTMVLPNVITANGDGKNEYWAPFLTSNASLDLSTVFDTYELKIFNRWGQIIFESTAGNSKWKVGDADEGTYFYTMIFETTCGEGAKGSREGNITVLR
jgi:CHU_C Type IX secretion signal domain